MVDRAVRLFTFLAKAQQQREKPIRDFSKYTGEGEVLWFTNLPERKEARWGVDDHWDEQPILSLERVSRVAVPKPPKELHLWVEGDVEDADSEVTLRTERFNDHGQRESVQHFPEVARAFEDWIPNWRAWAERTRIDRPLHDAYDRLFKVYLQTTQKSEEFELVLGVGLLTWNPSGHERVRRHVLTAQITPTLDERTGRLELHLDEATSGLKLELDMLDPHVIPDRALVRETEHSAENFDENPLDPASLAGLLQPLAHRLDSQGEWQDATDIPEIRDHPIVGFAPALILRQRRKLGLVAALTSIAEDIEEKGEVPDGILPLLDPDLLPPVRSERGDGALLAVGDELISPLPLNDQQRQILRRVDTHAQTLVQGPPGTGKTHTAAALLTHLLAQGQRVLVTAHTDRALHEVRDKLPQPIRSLAVSVIGASRDDMTDLRTAVDTLAQRSGEHDPQLAQGAIESALERLTRLAAARDELNHQLLDARQAEVAVHEHRGYSGTLAEIAQQYQTGAEVHGWVRDLVHAEAGSGTPLTNAEITEWLLLLRDESLDEDLDESLMRRALPEGVLTAPSFQQLVAEEKRGQAAIESFGPARSDLRFRRLQQLDASQREDLRRRTLTAYRWVQDLIRSRTPWMPGATQDVLAGEVGVWSRRADEVESGIKLIDEDLELLPLGTRVEIAGDHDRMTALAESLKRFLADGGAVETMADGRVKVGFFSPKTLKDSREIFESVKVNGRPPATPEAMDQVIAHRRVSRVLGELDSMWPADVDIPIEDNARERVEWHRAQLKQLRELLAAGTEVVKTGAALREVGVAAPRWVDPASAEELLAVFRAVEGMIRFEEVSAPLKQLEFELNASASWSDASPALKALHQAVTERDHNAYDAAINRLERLEEVDQRLRRRDELTLRVRAAAPLLAGEIVVDADEPEWDARLSEFEAAWDWAAVGEWVLAQERLDTNVIQEQILELDEAMREVSVEVASLRAWSHAVGADRLTPARRADLRAYSQLVARLGKGTGKYAAARRQEIRRAMERCRPAVPVWIMPIYRVAEQLAMEENSFDVVIVDEASQAGLEATFLQYLAPKIVVIGDDKQVSPSAVGMDQQQLRDLADQYLYGERYKDTWQDPKRSLFDEAAMRYGGQITLREHRRSVPEIIGFSNRIAYEPIGQPLIPVRQFGANRLEPFVARHVPKAGVGEINRSEAEALVDDLVERLDDPAYAGASMAVISLVGQRQAKYIESLLLERVPLAEWEARDLRVGIAPDFQGSERDVVFLSMVSTVDPEKRLAALTAESYVQRFNVAVSRAKDQIRLFHSVKPSEIPNHEDMRFQLLDYAYGVIGRGRELEADVSVRAPENVRDLRFDSLFEQRVHNRIVDRGFTVIPQFEAQGYKIDLVVVGSSRKLAIECDGDYWHGQAQYEADLARQRELERCGWHFVRIRESTFYIDPVRALEPLWQELEDMAIHPSDWIEESAKAPEVTVDLEEGDDVDDFERQDTLEPVALDPDDDIADPDSAAVGEPSGQTALESSESSQENSVQPREHRGLGNLGFELAGGSARQVREPSGIMRPYHEFAGVTLPATEATRREVVEGVVAIVQAEGPVCWSRVKTAYVHASGGRRVGKRISELLDGAMRYAVRQGLVVADGQTVGSRVGSTTLRLPEQDGVVIRSVGPRGLEEIPVGELRAVMGSYLESAPSMDFEAAARHVLGQYGWTSLTDIRRRLLEPVFDYCVYHLA